jgi:hypothetical protein
MMILPFGLKMYSFSFLNMAVHPAAHSVPIDIHDPDANFGNK